jgi:predicted nucleic acid-binding protein
MIFESRKGSGQRITPEWALLAHGDFEADLAAGVRLRRIPLTLTDIEREFDSLVRRHTATHGFRTYDIIHVASALKLKCRRFLSFDAKANSLARLAGLKTL